MSEFLLVLWCVAGIAFVLFHERADATLLRLGRFLARKIGEWFGLDVFMGARRANWLARPIALVVAVLVLARSVERGEGPWGIAFAIFSGVLFYTLRWFYVEPELIGQAETVRQMEMLTAALSEPFRRSLRHERRLIYLLLYLWAAPFLPQTTLAAVVMVLHAPLLTLSLTMLLFLSIEQPPFQHVTVRERLRAFTASLRPVGGSA